jgi:V/A-type H+-transporting ATPase subunit B
LKQLVIGKKTREDHPQVMNAAVRLYADAANARTKLENGFDLTDYDERALEFAKDYSEKLLAIDVNIGWMKCYLPVGNYLINTLNLQR